MVSAGAGLHHHPGDRLVDPEALEMGAREAPAAGDPAAAVRDGELEHVLGHHADGLDSSALVSTSPALQVSLAFGGSHGLSLPRVPH
jgi:hypothetical protein